MKKFQETYHLIFYKLNQFFKSLSDDGLSDWKAGLVIQTLQIFVLFIFVSYFEIITRFGIIAYFDSKIFDIAFVIILAVFNYNYFLGKKKWKVDETIFKSYSKKQNESKNLLVLSIILCVFFLLILSIYNYSQVDWTK